MTIDSLVRPSIVALKPYTPGTTVEQARRRYGLEHVVKLSSNENPWGSSPLAMEAIRKLTALNIYVDDDYRPLREKISDVYGLSPENIVLGHGSNEILALLYTTFVEPGEEVVMATPSFSLYRSDALFHGAVPVEIPLRDGVHDLEAMAQAVNPNTKMLIICDPNNPTGTQVSKDDFARFLAVLPEQIVLVLDQAYREYAEGGVEGVDVLRERANTIVLRTASKVWGLAALRFGFALTSSAVAAWMSRARLPFNVSLPALAGVSAALDDAAFIAQSVNMNRSERQRLVTEFEHLGLTTYPSQANFLAVSVPTTATVAYEGLLRRGIITRSGDGLRMPGYLRITVGTPDQNTHLLVALKQFLAECTMGSEQP